MAKKPENEETKPGSANASSDLVEEGDKPTCGVIMPISATLNHTDKHWADVQKIIHRFIANSGFSPKNVWENSSTDRVSERIIGNIFDTDIVVADISDLNPNVMLELGMRLSSKKPTVVIINKGGVIPFDIRDFHAVDYPADMNILGMEDFFVRLNKALNEKYESYTGDSYTPFLSNVIVDVISPQSREVSVDQLLISRLEDIGSRLSRIESSPIWPTSRTDIPTSELTSSDEIRSGRMFCSIPVVNLEYFCDKANDLFEVDSITKRRVVNEKAVLLIDYSGARDVRAFRNIIKDMAISCGGIYGIERPK